MKLAILMLSTEDAAIILPLLRFHDPNPKVAYYLCFKNGVLDHGNPFIHDHILLTLPDTSMPDTCARAVDILSDNNINHLLFATRASMKIWSEYFGNQGVSVWQGENHTMAVLNTQLDSLPAPEFWGRSIYSSLKHEVGSMNVKALRISTQYSEIGDYMKGHQAGEVFLSTNNDLVDALVSANPSAYIHYQIGVLGVSICLSHGIGSSTYFDKLSILNAIDVALGEMEQSRYIAYQNVRDIISHRGQAYSFFAEFYDQYMSHVDYNLWLDMIMGWVKRFSKQSPNRILELACGTANIAEALVAQGFDVDACDFSPFMLHMADAKLYKPNLWRQSMTDKLPEGRSYDLVLCLFDSVNYLHTKTEIKSMLANVYKAINPGGMFVFDISTLMNSRENFNDTTQFHQVHSGYLVHQAHYDSLANRQRSILTLFRKNALGYSKQVEYHSQRVYRTHDLIDLIAPSGFVLKGIFSPESRYNLIGKANVDIDKYYARLFFVLVKTQ